MGRYWKWVSGHEISIIGRKLPQHRSVANIGFNEQRSIYVLQESLDQYCDLVCVFSIDVKITAIGANIV